MFRSTLMLVFGLMIAGFAVGCGGSKKDKEATPPKETIPIIEGGPKAAIPGQPGGGGAAAKGEF